MYATYEEFVTLLGKAKKFERSPNPKIIDIMDPQRKVEVSSSSKLDPKVVRAIFLVPVTNVDEPMPVHMDVSPDDFQKLSTK